MRRAIQLALLGKGTVSPNPLVGCVVTVNDKIIGEGWHQKAGEAHAEVLAIQSVGNKDLLSEATVYVTLEPCAHFGKTPPCANLLVDIGVKQVVIGCTDPNPLVAGKGIEILEKAGIQVTLDCLKEECLALNNVFFHSILKKTPYIILKWAETADGFVARENYDSKWISNSMARQLVHKWRSENDAILVGKNTAKYDDPQLNLREWAGANPIRIVIDHHASLAPTLQVMDASIPTIIYNLEIDKEKANLHYVKLSNTNFYQHLLSDLYNRKISSVFVEGGTQTIQEFIELGLWNEARVFKSKKHFNEGIKAPQLKNHQFVSLEIIQDNYLTTYKNSL